VFSKKGNIGGTAVCLQHGCQHQTIRGSTSGSYLLDAPGLFLSLFKEAGKWMLTQCVAPSPMTAVRGEMEGWLQPA
jgi:hypothetical protein